MKYFAFVLLALLIAGCGGSNQPETDPAINVSGSEALEIASAAAGAPGLTSGISMANQEVCKTNMLSASTSINMYLVQYGTLPETLEEAGVFSVCPEGGEYIYTVDGLNWSLECPADPSHGSIRNGVVSW